MLEFSLDHAQSLALLGFIVKEVWTSIKGTNQKHEKALENNTLALVELKAEMKFFNMQFAELATRVKHLEDKK